MIRAGDAVIFFNFRPDRARQLVRALASAGLRRVRPRRGAASVALTTLTQYQEGWPYPVAFPPQRPSTTLAAVLAERGGRAAARGRDREVRPRDVLLQRRRGGRVPRRGAPPGRLAARRRRPTTSSPEMSAPRARRGLRRAPGRRATSGFGIVNFANPDMVGHTGVIEAAVAADRGGRRLPGAGPRRRAGSRAARCVITADHGNADHMIDRRRQPEHRPLAQPGAARGHRRRGRSADGGVLADVAPTVLGLLGERAVPDAMTGRSLIGRSA